MTMTVTFTVIKTAIVRLIDTETETLTVLVKMTSRVFVTEKESRTVMAILLYLETEDKLESETETMGETLRVTVTEVTVSLTI